MHSLRFPYRALGQRLPSLAAPWIQWDARPTMHAGSEEEMYKENHCCCKGFESGTPPQRGVKDGMWNAG